MKNCLPFFSFFQTLFLLGFELSVLAAVHKKGDWPYNAASIESPGMLFPRESETREIKLLDGIWDFKVENKTDLATEDMWYSRPLKEVSGKNLKKISNLGIKKLSRSALELMQFITMSLNFLCQNE